LADKVGFNSIIRVFSMPLAFCRYFHNKMATLELLKRVTESLLANITFQAKSLRKPPVHIRMQVID
jgi:hypothetical protein